MRGIFFLIFILTLASCNKDPSQELFPGDEYVFLELPAGFPPPAIPLENKLSKNRIALGKKLFYDKRFSRNKDVSCASCHFQENAFADKDRLSTGTNGTLGFRNAPSLANVAYHNSFFRDGGVPTLELQVLVPLDSKEEMDIEMKDVIDLLNADPEYVELFQTSYQREPDPFGFTRAIAAFERTLISGNSAYDKYNNGESSVFNESKKRGMNLFFSNRTNCSSCHSGFNFTNDSFENNGLYIEYADSGRMRVTLRESDRDLFKVPSLRNVEVTKPYMHDGSFESLEDVIEHYNSGGVEHINKSDLVKALSLSDREKEDLLAFLYTLTDEEFLKNPDYKP
ncbi:MAG: cytochrome-c peroxidase [Chitinophagales bacterium]|nr:cytochrome-c peroxidase [Chitinophagales bacterium]